MDNRLFNQIMDHIVCTLKANGYDPRFQLLAFLKTGDCTYITRQDNARKLIQQLDKEAVSRYVKDNFSNCVSAGREQPFGDFRSTLIIATRTGRKPPFNRFFQTLTAQHVLMFAPAYLVSQK